MSGLPAAGWLRRGEGLPLSSGPRASSPAPAELPELRTARENARLEIGSQRGRNSHQIGVLGIYDLQGLSYGRTELLVADMRLLAPDPSGSQCDLRLGACCCGEAAMPGPSQTATAGAGADGAGKIDKVSLRVRGKGAAEQAGWLCPGVGAGE